MAAISHCALILGVTTMHVAKTRSETHRRVMLHDFLHTHRAQIIRRVRARIASRSAPVPSESELKDGLPVFLDQLEEALAITTTSSADANHGEIAATARRRGQDLHRMGLTIAQVVHDYGNICQSITELAVEQDACISAEEFRILNLCLDDGIADAVTAYSHDRDEESSLADTERLGSLAHELRNLLNTATLAFEAIRSGTVPVSGSTSTVLARSLTRLQVLVNRSLASVRLDAGIEHLKTISVAELIEEIEISALLQAPARHIQLTVTPPDRAATIEGDAQVISAAISNLLQNAFKFTPKGGHVRLGTRTTPDRVLFEVEDECGGLPEGTAEGLFTPFSQKGSDRSGLGLGLSICQKAATVHHGEIRVENLPGKGCIFTLDLPRVTRPENRS